jgi:pyruvate/2-oxoglutarate dehydrogenase complex dihydrolipoamide acyltransferase (E2) component
VGPAIAPALSDKQVLALFEEGSYELVPHDGMRRTIAQRLTASTQTIPHFYLTMDCDIGKLIAAREEINVAAPKDKDGKPVYKLSVNDFVIKALALALQRVPDANVSWTPNHCPPFPTRCVILRRAPARASSSRRSIRADRARFRTSACTASRISPP